MPSQFAVGQRVLARFGAAPDYFPGTISSVCDSSSSGATYGVAYDDGDSEEGVSAALLADEEEGVPMALLGVCRDNYWRQGWPLALQTGMPFEEELVALEVLRPAAAAREGHCGAEHKERDGSMGSSGGGGGGNSGGNGGDGDDVSGGDGDDDASHPCVEVLEGRHILARVSGTDAWHAGVIVTAGAGHSAVTTDAGESGAGGRTGISEAPTMVRFCDGPRCGEPVAGVRPYRRRVVHRSSNSGGGDDDGVTVQDGHMLVDEGPLSPRGGGLRLRRVRMLVFEASPHLFQSAIVLAEPEAGEEQADAAVLCPEVVAFEITQAQCLSAVLLLQPPSASSSVQPPAPPTPPARFAIIGGGGGVAPMALVRLFPSLIAHVDVVELSDSVMTAATRFFGLAPRDDGCLGCGGGPTVSLHVMDGLDYVRAAPRGSLDVVIIDAVDAEVVEGVGSAATGGRARERGGENGGDSEEGEAGTACGRGEEVGEEVPALEAPPAAFMEPSFLREALRGALSPTRGLAVVNVLAPCRAALRRAVTCFEAAGFGGDGGGGSSSSSAVTGEAEKEGEGGAIHVLAMDPNYVFFLTRGREAAAQRRALDARALAALLERTGVAATLPLVARQLVARTPEFVAGKVLLGWLELALFKAMLEDEAVSC